MIESLHAPHVEIGVELLTLPGQTESGDLWVLKSYTGGALVAALDGCGHGAEAAAAARLARSEIEAHVEESMISLVIRCHHRLRGTRGVVMSLASFSASDPTMAWLGVGNVEGLLFRGVPQPGQKFESLFLRPGVVGYRLPPLDTQVLPLSPGDLLILATDGIRSDFADVISLDKPPQKIAAEICERFSKKNDDGLVLVARYLG